MKLGLIIIGNYLEELYNWLKRKIWENLKKDGIG